MRDRGDHCHCVVYGIDFSWFAAGLSALLTWLMNVPGPRRDRFTGRRRRLFYICDSIGNILMNPTPIRFQKLV